MALKGTTGTSMRTLRRSDLKPKREPSDAQLLKSAQRLAERAAKQMERSRRAEQAEREFRRA